MTQDKRRKGEEKQTERIEVRLGLTLRDRFLAACKRAGDTPSDVLRAAMSTYVEVVELAERNTLRQELTMKLIRNPLKAASIAGAGLVATILFGAAPSMADDSFFDQLDKNGDGYLSSDETNLLEDVQNKIDITQVNLPEGYDASDIVSIERLDYKSYDTDGDGRFSREEFRAIDGVSFEFDGNVAGHQLNNADGEPKKITFLGPDGVASDKGEAHYRDLLKSGDVKWLSKEPGKETFVITTIVKPDENEDE